jgi:hypothetical protein
MISIFSNPELYDCGVQSVCEYLISPKGEVNIFYNATGCNNPAEIANQCGTTLPCLAYGNYYLTSQAEVDSFQYVYPGCSEIEGSLNIGGEDITNLEGLSVINSINGDLEIGFLFHGWDYHNPLLESLNGLDNLTNVDGFVQIWYNSSLSDLSGLEQLTEIGGKFEIFRNDNLISLAGLDNLETIGGYLGLMDNDNLISLAGFVNVSTIGEGIYISYNDALTGLEGLDNINAASIDNLLIRDNNSLSTCDVQSICNYLAAPNGTITIEDNAPGCNSQEEIIEACSFGTEESAFSIQQSAVTVYPNPTSGVLSFGFRFPDSGKVTLKIYDLHGREVATVVDEVLPAGEHTVSFDASELPAGVYIWKNSSVVSRQSSVGKFIKY